MKKLLSVILALTLVMTAFCSITAFAVEETEESTYVVAGNNADVFGLIWYKYPTATNTMTKDGDIYTLTIKDVEPQAGLDFQVVENTPDGKQKIYGYRSSSIYDEPGVEFRVIEKCDVTFTFDPSTKYVDVIGDGVKRISGVDRVYAYDYHKKLTNGVYDQYHDKGEMTLGEDGVYSVTYKDVQPAESIIIDVNDQTLGELQMGFYGFNFCAIDVTKTCDVTIYYECDRSDLDNSKIWAEGDGVVIRTKPLIDELFINGSFTDYKYSEANALVEVDEYVYKKTFENLTSETEYEFTIYNESEAYRDIWGTDCYDTIMELGKDIEVSMYPFIYATNEINFAVPYANSNVTITFDLTNFDYVSKNGAKIRIDATDMRGDLNVDGEVSIVDVTDVQKGLADIITFTDNQKISGDVNGDGEVTVVDATIIQKYIAGLCESFDNVE